MASARKCSSIVPSNDNPSTQSLAYFSLTQPTTRPFATTPEPKITLTTLPTEIQIQIFTHLSHPNQQIKSICLGLTCRAFYRLHRFHHPYPIPLQFFEHEDLELIFQKQLFQLLKYWIGAGYELHFVKRPGGKKEKWMFLTEQAWQRVQNERKRILELKKLYEF